MTSREHRHVGKRAVLMLAVVVATLMACSGAALAVTVVDCSSLLQDPLTPLCEGTEQDDDILGRGAEDTILAFGGNDTVHANGADDHVDAGVGDDEVYGGAGPDSLAGGPDDDDLFGGRAATLLQITRTPMQTMTSCVVAVATTASTPSTTTTTTPSYAVPETTTSLYST